MIFRANRKFTSFYNIKILNKYYVIFTELCPFAHLKGK